MDVYHQKQFNKLKFDIIDQIYDYNNIMDQFYSTEQVQVVSKNIKGLSFDIKWIMMKIIQELPRLDSKLSQKLNDDIKSKDLKDDIIQLDKVINKLKHLETDRNYKHIQFEVKRFHLHLTYFVSDELKKEIIQTLTPTIYFSKHK